MISPPTEPLESPTLSPSDNVRMIVELLKPAGPELARHWLATQSEKQSKPRGRKKGA
ncbi:MAG: hypothetical protein AAGD00_04150 [Planctomycetota bacterium]